MIVAKTWRETRLLILIYLVVMHLLMLPPILLWEDLYHDFQTSSLFVALGKFLPGAVEGLRNPVEQKAFAYFMAIQLFFRAINFCGIAFAVLLGTCLVARERENHTLEFLLARPISRSRILWSKFWVTGLALTIPIFLTSWSTILLSSYMGFSLSFANLSLGAFHSSLFVLGMLALTTLCSVIFRSQMHAAATVGLFVIANLAIYFVQTVRTFSILQLSDFDTYARVMLGNVNLGGLFWEQGIWLCIAAAALYALADFLFRRATP